MDTTKKQQLSTVSDISASNVHEVFSIIVFLDSKVGLALSAPEDLAIFGHAEVAFLNFGVGRSGLGNGGFGKSVKHIWGHFGW